MDTERQVPSGNWRRLDRAGPAAGSPYRITPACFGSTWVTFFPAFPVDQLRLAFCFSPWLLVSPIAFWL